LRGIAKVFSSRHWAAEIRETKDSADLASQAQQAIQAGVGTLFAMGGDGTVQALVNATFAANLVLGIIPAGGGNDFAKALGFPRDPIAALELALAGEPRAVDLVRVRTSEGKDRLYLGGGGVGLDAESAKHASGRYRNWPGRWRYVAAALLAFQTHRALEVRIVLDEEEAAAKRGKLLLASVLNTPTLGAGIRLAPEAQIDDGLLELILIEELRRSQILGILPGLLFSGKLDIPQLSRFTVRRVRIETEPAALFHGDGEILGSTPVEIEVMPAALTVLAPKRRDRERAL
jgi:diacylglycerol kinase (ATP)